MRDHLAKARIWAEEVFPDVVALLHGITLELAVHRHVHLVQQHAVFVLGEQLIPFRAPNDLDDVPARPTEDRFEFLDDLSVAAHRAIKSLQVAVDDKDEIVELLTRCERNCAEGLGLVGLAVAEEGPHPAVGGVVHLAVQKVAIETSVVERSNGAKAHRHGGKLPEIRHQSWVWVA